MRRMGRIRIRPLLSPYPIPRSASSADHLSDYYCPHHTPHTFRILDLILQPDSESESESEPLESKLDPYRRSLLLRLSPAITSTVLRSRPRPHRPPPSVPTLVRTFCSLPPDETDSAGSTIKQLVCGMRTSGVRLTGAAAAELMKSLGTGGRVEEMLAVWREMKSAGVEPSLVHYNCLMECLVNSGFVDSAEKVFYSMREEPDTVSYNTLIKGYCESGRGAKAVELFKGMKERGAVQADEVTYLSLMQCHYDKQSFGDCLYMYQEMERRGMDIPPHAGVFVITGLCKDGRPFEGLKMFEQMLEKEFQPNLPVYNALIESFGNCGRADLAVSFFERMKNDGLVPNEVTYSVIINSLCKSGDLDEAMKYLRVCEKEGVGMVNVVMYASLINAFSKAGMVEQAQLLFDEMPGKCLLPDSQCYNAMIDAFVRAGRIDDALDHAKRMENDGFDATVYTYTVLIHGLFAKHRNEEAIKLWYHMVNEKGLIPTDAAFRVLSRGLCLSGKFNIACKVIDEVAPMGLVVDNAYEEMLNVLCKAGRFKQACMLADNIVGKGREIPGRIRTAMINALRKAGNADLAIKLMHSKIGIGYERFGSIKRRVKFQTLFD